MRPWGTGVTGDAYILHTRQNPPAEIYRSRQDQRPLNRRRISADLAAQNPDPKSAMFCPIFSAVCGLVGVHPRRLQQTINVTCETGPWGSCGGGLH